MSHNTDTTYSVFFSVTDSQFEQLYTAMFSLLRNNAQAKVHFYIISHDFSDANKDRLVRLLNLFEHAGISHIAPDRENFHNMSLANKSATLGTYCKYMLAEIAPHLDKALYLDTDVVIDGSLLVLWDTVLGDCYFAGVKDSSVEDSGHKKKIALAKKALYVNDSVLLFNLRKMREDHMGERLLALAREPSEHLLYTDQDILNIACQGRIHEVSEIYNFSYENALDRETNDEKPIIIRYNDPHKPWNLGCSHPLRNKWIQYYAASPFANLEKVIEWLTPIPFSVKKKYYIFGIRVLEVLDYISFKKWILLGFIRVTCKVRDLY